MELRYEGQRRLIEAARYPQLISDLAFLHTYAAETWEQVTGKSHPEIRTRVENSISSLPRNIEKAGVEEATEQKLNTFFANRYLLWPFNEEATGIKSLKQKSQSGGLRQLLLLLEPSAVPRERPVLRRKVTESNDNASRELLHQFVNYREIIEDRLESLRHQMETMQETQKRTTSDRIDQLEKVLVETNARYAQSSEEQKFSTRRWIEEKQTEIKAFQSDIAARADALKDQADKWQAEKNSEIESTKEAYRISFATQKAHEYWAETKYRRHTKLARKSFWVGMAYVALVLGGAVAFMYLGAGLFNQPIWQTPLTLALPLAIAVITSVWLGRLLARTYMAHIQLAEDAQERATMIETYIALIRANVLDGSKADEAQKALFRSASTGLLAGDNGPDTPIEIISKAISTQK